MGLEHRLKRLEAAASAFSPRRACPGCGHSPGEAERYVLSPIDLDDDESQPPGPERCEACGRQLVVRLAAITLDDGSLP